MNISDIEYIYNYPYNVTRCCKVVQIYYNGRWPLWRQMRHKNTTLSIAAIIAAVAVTALAFDIPQQALAVGHHHNHNSNSIKVEHQIDQANVCNGTSTLCLNVANNTANVHRWSSGSRRQSKMIDIKSIFSNIFLPYTFHSVAHRMLYTVLLEHDNNSKLKLIKT